MFLEVQADRLSLLKTRLVVPLSSIDELPERLGNLHPIVEVLGEPLVLVTHFAVAVPVADLGTAVATLTDEDYDIARVLDILIGTA